MIRLTRYSALVVFAGLVVGCELIGPGTPRRDDDRVVVSERLPAHRAPARVTAADATGPRLHLRVQYGGGCAAHEWVLHAHPALTHSVPPTATLRLGHDANGDPCDAVVTDTLAFDLTPALDVWRRGDYRGPLLLEIHAPAASDTLATALTITL